MLGGPLARICQLLLPLSHAFLAVPSARRCWLVHPHRSLALGAYPRLPVPPPQAHHTQHRRLQRPGQRETAALLAQLQAVVSVHRSSAQPHKAVGPEQLLLGRLQRSGAGRRVGGQRWRDSRARVWQMARPASRRCWRAAHTLGTSLPESTRPSAPTATRPPPAQRWVARLNGTPCSECGTRKFGKLPARGAAGRARVILHVLLRQTHTRRRQPSALPTCSKYTE